jgi:NAD(P)-dependent dehydrogenase (short-subunit alcohol dehydrogenase family)
MLLEDKVAIVSGIGPGLGRSIALLFAKEGADLVLSGNTRDDLDAVGAEVEALGRKPLFVFGDITDRRDARDLAGQTVGRFGRIDILINNAFASGPTVAVAEMGDEDFDAWRRCVEVNMYGTMLVCHYVAPHMIAAKRGSIVCITSRSMRQGRLRRSAYSASKAGVTLLAQVLAAELGPHGIRVNCVAPGQFWSAKLKAHYEASARADGKTYEEWYAALLDQIALRRVAQIEEVAAAVLFMASDQASAITGQSLDVNQGHYFH